MRESGELVLAPASPQAFRPSARAQILPGVVRPFPQSPTASSTSATRTRSSVWICGADMRRRVLAVALVSLGAIVAHQRRRRRRRIRATMLDRAIDDFLAGRVSGIGRRLRPRRGAGTRRRAATLAARHRALLRRPLRRLPRAVRVAPHGQSQRRRECGLALPLRRARRVAAKARAALLPVGPDQRSPMREIYQMFRGTMPPEASCAAGGDRRRRGSSRSCTSGCITRRPATRRVRTRTRRGSGEFATPAATCTASRHCIRLTGNR